MVARSKNEKTIKVSMKILKVDAALKPSDTNTSGSMEGSSSDVTSCISSVDATASSIKGSEVDQEPFDGNQGMCYYGYCYPGFSSPFGEWDDQSYYMPTDNFEFQTSTAQADNGSLLYYLPGYQPGYSSYNSIIPGAAIGIEGQYLGQPSYYSNPMLQQPGASLGLAPQSFAYGAELVPVYPWDSALLFANGLQVHGFYGDPSFSVPNSSFSSRNQNNVSSKTSPPSNSSTSETRGSSLGAAAPKSVNKGSDVLSKGSIPISKIPTYANQGKGGVLCRPINVKESGRNWVGVEKMAARTKLHGLSYFEVNEQNRSPRTNSNKNTLDFEVNLVGSPDAGKNGNSCAVIPTVRKDMYNLPDFSTKYDDALFFVIKSYSEDDVHKSIKYNVWASTSNGNRRLDNAFQLAQEKMAEKGCSCPVFLFFSVNASGQFCGVAEILDHVDFNKSMDFWQQDKWNGYFPVKWHIIKDVPNPQFRHILLENNENKPVTNSRDTQEVKFPQGIEMLNIFKSYISRTSILDDFDFYESRQKVMQHKRSKLPVMHFGYPSPKMEESMQVPKPDGPKTISSPNSSVEIEAGK